ncbi:hypothetical protein O7627_04655 [Solwaraspora sp. WMMD1047]|uniref:hypothetical protein n=1 Tax=Solwaraspora sp. WMMD1047 TaxID=3016102 RepID=UPI002417C858|nr:hypothetical protein [Solwaraspora sp. WMMD1047]MDG4828595.1 hypothetical protein [Solwaraspora sp. WMMD1047]
MGATAADRTDEKPKTRVLSTVGMLLGVLAVGTAFLAAHVGALHQPTPKDVPVGVARTDQRAVALLDAVRAETDKIQPIRYADPDAADEALAERAVYAILASAPAGGSNPPGGSSPGGDSESGAALTLTVASASAPTATDLIQQVLAGAAKRAGVTLDVTDAAPTSAADPRGLVPFYLTSGLVFGGYLAATMLSQAGGTAAPNPRASGIRIAALGGYSALLGVIGAVIAGPVVHVWDHDLVAVAAAGALVTLAAALLAAAVQSWLGPLGTGLVILLLVALGPPTSGGATAPEFLPSALRGVHRWNIPGLGTDLIRSVAYFDHRAFLRPLTGLVGWVAFGLAGTFTATIVKNRRRARERRSG